MSEMPPSEVVVEAEVILPMAPAPSAVDMSVYDLACATDADCTLVRPSHCGPCGCTATPLAARDREAFRAALAEVRCPPPNEAMSGISCGGCPGYVAVCTAGRCGVGMR